MFSSIHLSIGVFLRCNFLYFTVIALYNFNCIHARLLRDFFNEVSVSVSVQSASVFYTVHFIIHVYIITESTNSGKKPYSEYVHSVCDASL